MSLSRIFLCVVLGLCCGFVALGDAQQPPPQSLPDQLTQCTALLRVKQDLPCRCEQAEQLAARVLFRAEQAEQALKMLQEKLDALASKEKANDAGSKEENR